MSEHISDPGLEAFVEQSQAVLDRKRAMHRCKKELIAVWESRGYPGPTPRDILKLEVAAQHVIKIRSAPIEDQAALYHTLLCGAIIVDPALADTFYTYTGLEPIPEDDPELIARRKKHDKKEAPSWRTEQWHKDLLFAVIEKIRSETGAETLSQVLDTLTDDERATIDALMINVWHYRESPATPGDVQSLLENIHRMVDKYGYNPALHAVIEEVIRPALQS